MLHIRLWIRSRCALAIKVDDIHLVDPSPRSIAMNGCLDF